MIYIVTPLSKKLQQLTLTGFSKALFSPIAASNSIGNHIFTFIYSYSFRTVALTFINMLSESLALALTKAQVYIDQWGTE